MIKQGQGSNEVNIWLKVICQFSEATNQGLNERLHTRGMDKNWSSKKEHQLKILRIKQIPLQDNMLSRWIRKINQKQTNPTCNSMTA